MMESDPLAGAFRAQRDALAELAPPPDFTTLWREVEVRRERGLHRILLLAAAAPAVLLFLGGLAALLLGGGLLSAMPLLALAIWLIVGGVDFTPLPVGDAQVSRAPRGSALSGGQGDLRMKGPKRSLGG